MLASPDLPGRERVALRRCVSAGEALPRRSASDGSATRRRHRGRHRLDRDAAHLYVEPAGRCPLRHNRQAGPGYELEHARRGRRAGRRAARSASFASGPSGALIYWGNRKQTPTTFLGEWTRSGDKYFRDADGYYVYCGRSDDMLKVSGMYVSPVEVEAALVEHPAVVEAAVVGADDAMGCIRPKAFVVCEARSERRCEPCRGALRLHARTRLAHFKCPRWITFIDDLPKTTTGRPALQASRGIKAGWAEFAGNVLLSPVRFRRGYRL